MTDRSYYLSPEEARDFGLIDGVFESAADAPGADELGLS